MGQASILLDGTCDQPPQPQPEHDGFAREPELEDDVQLDYDFFRLLNSASGPRVGFPGPVLGQFLPET